MRKVYWGKYPSAFGNIYGLKTDQGLCYLSGPNEQFEEIKAWARKRMGDVQFIHHEKELEAYFLILEAYLNKEIKVMDVPLDFYGTAFQKEVWDVLGTIPYGETMFYEEVARRLNRPNAWRAVGNAIGANPLLFFVPCHRVIQKSGKMGGFRGGIEVKSKLLSLERKSGDHLHGETI